MMTSLSNDNDGNSILPPPPIVMDDTAQILQNILGDEEDDYTDDEEEVEININVKEQTKTNTTNAMTKPSTTTMVETTESDVVHSDSGSDSEVEDYEEEEEEEFSESDDEYSDSDDGSSSGSEEEEEVVLSTMEEKHSLLALAAEHDRVDILQAILEQESADNFQELLFPTSANASNSANSANRNSPVEAPLSIACRFKSTHAATCLLRWGAPPQFDSTNTSTSNSIMEYATVMGHAIEAETLRAIGADEWSRLKQFIDVGLDRQTFTIANRSLLDWSHDMNASTCITHLTPPTTTTTTNDNTNDTNDTNDNDNNKDPPSEPTSNNSNSTSTSTAVTEPTSNKINRDTHDNQNNNNDDDDDDNQNNNDLDTEKRKEENHVSSQEEDSVASSAVVVENGTSASSGGKKRVVGVWERQLEESEALAGALSQLLDSLAEEVSVTQGLLYNKNALLSHIAAIKTTRATKEDELQEWQRVYDDYQLDLQDITENWYHTTNPELSDDEYYDYDEDYEYEPILPLPQPPTTTEQPTPPPPPTTTTPVVEPQQLFAEEKDRYTDEQWKELYECSQLRVTKLRSSITDLADEKAKDMKEIERLGLTGAVHLAQTLREEVQTIQQQLQYTRNQAASTRLQIDTIRDALERLLLEPPPPSDTTTNTTPRSHHNPYLELEKSPNHPTPSSTEQPLDHEDNPTDLSAVVYDHNNHAAAQAVVPYVIRKGYLPHHLWDLILRIFGLGKRSVKKAVRDQLTATPIKK